MDQDAIIDVIYNLHAGLNCETRKWKDKQFELAIKMLYRVLETNRKHIELIPVKVEFSLN